MVPNIQDVQCFGEETGRVEIDVQGGSGAYQYAISPNLNQFDDVNIFEDLAPGEYSIIVQDGNGCFELVEFEITEPELLEMEVTTTPEICAGEEDGSITIGFTGGTAPYSTAINGNSDADFIEGRDRIENLAGGDYIVFVRDANGCTINQTVTVTAGANLNATAEVFYECSGSMPDNSLRLILEDESISDDVLYALDSTDPNDFVLSPDFADMSPGSHFVTLAHANGCINTINFEVATFEPLELVLEQRNLNEITAVASGGGDSYTFFLDGEDKGDDDSWFITRTDTYTVRVVDSNGCEATATIFMEFIDIEIPNFFTPDGDNRNDVWKPKNIEQYPDIFIKIFDRYGREVYIIDNESEGWDGYIRNQTCHGRLLVYH